jgi:hypothetical protein
VWAYGHMGIGHMHMVRWEHADLLLQMFGLGGKGSGSGNSGRCSWRKLFGLVCVSTPSPLSLMPCVVCFHPANSMNESLCLVDVVVHPVA